MADESLVRRLAQWVTDFNAADIPLEVMAQAKVIVLDSLGCAIAAQKEHSFRAALDAVEDLGGPGDCTVVGMRERTSLLNAVLLNGILIRALDLNDIYVGPKQNGHPSDNVAVALAFSEHQKSSGRELLATIIMGYELYCRLQDLADPTGPWDHVTMSSLAAPAMAGRLLGSEPAQLAHALALSAAHGNTLGAVRFGQLSNAKNLANAIVAYIGTFATLLARQGLTGPSNVLEGSHGLSRGVFSNGDLSSLVEPVKGQYRLMDVSIKAYPCIGTAQTAVGAALKARSLLREPLDEIAAVELKMANIPFVRTQLEDLDRRRPQTRETADHSFHYLVSIALIDGDLTPRGFEGERWLDPSVNSMMERMTISADDGLNAYTPGTFPCVLELTTRTGRRHRVEMFYSPGHPKNRMSAAQVESKFRHCCESTLSEDRQTRILREVERLDESDSVAELMGCLAA